jgi:hypothetical protein
MNHRKIESGNLISSIKNIFFNNHHNEHAPLIPGTSLIEKEDKEYSDYIRVYQQATRWKF